MPDYYTTHHHPFQHQREQQVSSYVPSLPSTFFPFDKHIDSQADGLPRPNLYPVAMERKSQQWWPDSLLSNSQQRRTYSSSPASSSGTYRYSEPGQSPYTNYAVSPPAPRAAYGSYYQPNMSIKRSPSMSYSIPSVPSYSAVSSRTASLQPPDVQSSQEPPLPVPPERPVSPGAEKRHWFLRLPPRAYEIMGTFLAQVLVAQYGHEQGTILFHKTYHSLQCIFSSRKLNSARNRYIEDPQDTIFLPWRLKHLRMLRAEREHPTKEREPGMQNHFACYLCHRMKHEGEFQESVRHNDNNGDKRPGQHHYARVHVYRDAKRPGPQKFYVPVDADTARSRETSVALDSRRSSVVSVVMGGMGDVPPPPPSWEMRSREGAGEGEVEKLRRYCIDCAIRTCLTRPSDHFHTRLGKKCWVCTGCKFPRWYEDEKQMECAFCGKHQGTFR